MATEIWAGRYPPVTSFPLIASASASVSVAEASTSSIPKKQGELQVLVKLDNATTHLLTFPSDVTNPHNDDNIEISPLPLPDEGRILRRLSFRTGIPSKHLRLRSRDAGVQRCGVVAAGPNVQGRGESSTAVSVHFLSAYTHIPLLGGKGGFGTLLKGQSKQAGAKTTLDFGACRDLSGRRLRHVNDEIKLRKWRDAKRRRERGVPVDEVEELKTESGIRNWHLMVPNWSDGAVLSKKSREKAELKLRVEVGRWQSVEERERLRRREERERFERSVVEYVEAGTKKANSGGTTGDMGDAVRQGMREKLMGKKKKSQQQKQSPASAAEEASVPKESERSGKRKLDSVSGVTDDEAAEDGSPSSLCTLSGEIVTNDTTTTTSTTSSNDTDAQKKNQHLLIQSQSEFATAAFLLTSLPTDATYYEVSIRTAGIAQIGWASSDASGAGGVFSPNSDTGDGVGDDGCSYGYDGGRELIFHDGKEIPYPRGQPTEDGATGDDPDKKKASEKVPAEWKEGDIIGCLFDPASGQISYSINGTNMGVAFTIPKDKRNLYPALSLNEGEIVGVNVGPKFEFEPEGGFVGVGTLMALEENRGRTEQKEEGEDKKMSGGGGTDGRALTTTAQPKPSTRLLGSGPPPMILPPPPPPPSPREPPTGKRGSATSAALAAAAAAAATLDAKEETKPPLTSEGPPEPVDLDKYQSAKELEVLGMDRLKGALLALGLKCGGSLEERAKRLFSVKGLKREEYPMKARGKNFVV